jgi:hypothetical protein
MLSTLLLVYNVFMIPFSFTFCFAFGEAGERFSRSY